LDTSDELGYVDDEEVEVESRKRVREAPSINVIAINAIAL
jgi:hypothetical protein